MLNQLPLRSRGTGRDGRAFWGISPIRWMARLVFSVAFLQFIPSVSALSATSLTCSPSVITGGSGGSATCTVTLDAPAPAGGKVVTLTSSLLDLAASLPTVTVPAGQTSASFTVATNPNYRRYSGLAFSVTITASADGTPVSATLNVTAQPRPPDFNSGSQAGSNTQWEGLMCGEIAPLGGDAGILYRCSRAAGTGFGSCTFVQECNLGCRRVPPTGAQFKQFSDFCATSGSNPVSLSSNYIVGGDRIPGIVTLEAPAGSAGALEQGVLRTVDPNANSTTFPQVGVSFPIGSTSVSFDVATSYLPVIQFVNVVGHWFNAGIPPFLITNGRAGQDWLVMLPPAAPPSVAMPTLGDFKITGNNPIVGGEQALGQIDLSGLSRVGGPTIMLTSSHPDIVPPMTFDAPVSNQFFGFQVRIPTNPPAADTDVTITASDGRYRFSTFLRVLAPPPPPVLSGISVNPTSVVGGNPATGTVTLSGPQTTPTVVQLSIVPTAPATVPSSVTVPAGATSANFTISTSPVSEQFNLNIFAQLQGSPEQSALLLITPNSDPTLSSLSLNPTTVVGGNSSTGTVTLSAAAPSGGTVVSLVSSDTSVATVPASVTVPAGATSANFTITTAAVTTDKIVTLTAITNNTGRTADLIVTAASGAPAFRNPTANAADSGGDGNGFQSNPANAHNDDTLNAVDTNSGNGTSTSCTSTAKDKHRFFNYGFSIPTGATVAGIEVRLDARADSTASAPKMCVQLSWDGGVTWTAAKSTATLGTSMSTFILGSPTDTWGRTWNSANLTDTNFRVRVINVSNSTSRDFFLDWVAVRVTYSGGGGPTSPPSSPTPSAIPPSATPTRTPTATATSSGPTATSTRTPTQVPSTDTVTIQRAEYAVGNQELRVEATSTSSNATLQVFVTSTNQLIGTLQNDGGGRYSGRFSLSTNPQNITVRSSFGGSASTNVIAR
jgi:hypothetical protein